MSIADEIAALPEFTTFNCCPDCDARNALAYSARLALAQRLLLETRHSFGAPSGGVVFRDIAQWVKDRDALLAAMEPPP